LVFSTNALTLHLQRVANALDGSLIFEQPCIFQNREGEELFQFLFLETEIKNSWEAYFEDAKQKLGMQLLSG